MDTILYENNSIELLEEVVSELYCYFDSDATIKILEKPSEQNSGVNRYISISYDGDTGRTVSGYTKTVPESKIVDAYKNGVSVFDIANTIVREYNDVEHSYKRVHAEVEEDNNFMLDFDTISKNIEIKIVNKFKNSYLVEDKLYREMFDFYITPVLRIRYDGDADTVLREGPTNAICYISKDIIKEWNKTEDEIFDVAFKNVCNKKKYNQKMIDFLMKKIDLFSLESGIPKEELEKGLTANNDIAPDFVVISNEEKNLGANVIFDRSFLDYISSSYCNSDDMGIILSSVHEAIVFKYDRYAEDNLGNIVNMIREINDTQLGDQDVASDLLYIYSPKDKTINVCGNNSYNPYVLT